MKKTNSRERLITYKGKTQNMKQWSEELNLSYSAIAYRLCTAHWSVDKAFETPMNPNQKLITYKGKTQSLVEWCQELRLPYYTIKDRINKLCWSVESAFSESGGEHRKKNRKASQYSKLYKILRDMKARCYNPNRRDYKWYGGRGITICNEWLDTEKASNEYNASKGGVAFRDWALTHGYKEGLTIDRIDCSKGYYPDNCRWVTIAEQQRNKSSSHFITYKGQTKTLLEWSRELGFWHGTLRHRLCNLHWSVEKAFETPVNSNGNRKDEK